MEEESIEGGSAKPVLVYFCTFAIMFVIGILCNGTDGAANALLSSLLVIMFFVNWGILIWAAVASRCTTYDYNDDCDIEKPSKYRWGRPIYIGGVYPVEKIKERVIRSMSDNTDITSQKSVPIITVRLTASHPSESYIFMIDGSFYGYIDNNYSFVNVPKGSHDVKININNGTNDTIYDSNINFIYPLSFNVKNDRNNYTVTKEDRDF